MMLEIFRALRALQFEWKIVAQYSLKCRPCTARTASGGEKCSSKHPWTTAFDARHCRKKRRIAES